MKFDQFSTLLTIVLSGSGVLGIKALVDGIRSISKGVTSRDKNVLGSVIKQRDELDARLEMMTVSRDAYRNRVGTLEYTLERNGFAVPPWDAPKEVKT